MQIWLTFSRINVGSGSTGSISCNMLNNRGSTTVSSTVTVQMPNTKTKTGYATAAVTSPRTSSSCSSSVGQIGHDFGQHAAFLAHAHHAGIKFAEQFRMFLQRRRKRRAFAHRIGNFQTTSLSAGFSSSSPRLSSACGIGNRRAEQRADFPRQRRDVLAFDPIGQRKNLPPARAAFLKPPPWRLRRWRMEFQASTETSPRRPSNWSALLRSSASITPGDRSRR
jgi:hypothetical protein